MSKAKIRGYLIRVIMGLLGIAMMAISLYLADHYFDAHFPTNLKVGALCDISRFWNCDSATFSPLSSFFNVPTAMFGFLFGLIVLCGAIFYRFAIHNTNYFLAILNLLGCIVLFLYSLIFLGGLCPGCTVYYVLALILVIAYFFSDFYPKPQAVIIGIYVMVGVLLFLGTILFNQERASKQDKILASFVRESKKQRVYDENDLGFSFPLVKATDRFIDAPLRITLLSDFQCPFCKVLGDEIIKTKNRYPNQLNVRYIFFPMDNRCNYRLNSSMHPFACQAAKLSFCAKDNFLKVHDEIYEHQIQLSEKWLADKAKEYGVHECYTDEKSDDAVREIVNSTKKYDLDPSVPTMLINGRKLSGLIPAKALIVLMDALLKEEANNSVKD